MKLTIVNPAEFGIEETKANELTIGLKTILAEREMLIDAYNDVICLEITLENLETFKSLRLKIRDNRTKGIEKWHTVNKAYFLAGGRFCDAIKNKEASINDGMEEKLAAAEKHFENLEKERLLVIHNERVGKLSPFGYEIGNTDFASMDENMFNAILTGAETNHKAKLESELKAEQTRIENIRLEAEEKEKQHLEMDRLRKENEEKEKQIELERIEAEKKAQAEKAKADAALAESKRLAKIESDKQAKILADQKAANDKLQAELKAREDAEAKVKSDAVKAEALRLSEEKKVAKAPDKQKLKEYILSLGSDWKYDLKTPEASKLLVDINVKFAAFQKWANDQIEMYL